MSARMNARQLSWRYKHYSTTILWWRQDPFNVYIEDRIEKIFSDRPDRRVSRNPGIGEHNVDLAFLFFDLGEQAIKIVEIRHVTLDRGYILSDLFFRRRQLGFTTP